VKGDKKFYKNSLQTQQ